MANNFLSSTERLLNACSGFYPAPSPQHAPPSSLQELANVVARERFGVLDRLLTQAEEQQLVISDSSADDDDHSTIVSTQNNEPINAQKNSGGSIFVATTPHEQRLQRLCVYRCLCQHGFELSPTMNVEKEQLEERIGLSTNVYAKYHGSLIRDIKRLVLISGVAALDQYPQPLTKKTNPAEPLARCQQRARRLIVYRLLSESGIELPPEMVKEKDELEDRIGRTADFFADRHHGWMRDIEQQVQISGVAVLDNYPQPLAKEAAPAETLERCNQKARRLIVYRLLSESGIGLPPEKVKEKNQLERSIGHTADLFAQTNRNWMQSTNLQVRATGVAVLDKYPHSFIKAAKKKESTERLDQRVKRLCIYRCLVQNGVGLPPEKDAERKQLENRIGLTTNCFAERHLGVMLEIAKQVQTNGVAVLDEYPLSDTPNKNT